MIKAFTGKTYTADRENLWRKIEHGGFNSNLTRHEESGVLKTTRIRTAMIDIANWNDSSPRVLMFSALENARGGLNLIDFSEAGSSYIITASWSINPDSDYHFISPAGAKIYGKRNLVNDVPHLKFVSSSSRHLSTGVLPHESHPDLSIFCYITPLVVGQEQYIFSLEGSFSVYIDSDDYVNFMISDGVDTYTGKSTNKVSLQTQSRIVCIKDDATDKMIIHVDSTKTEISSITIEPLLADVDLFVGCKDVSGSKSNYLDACLHTIAIAGKSLSDADISLIDNSIDPLGLEIIAVTYDDAAGSVTGIPYGLKTVSCKHPTYEYEEMITKTNTSLGVSHA